MVPQPGREAKRSAAAAVAVAGRSGSLPGDNPAQEAPLPTDVGLAVDAELGGVVLLRRVGMLVFDLARSRGVGAERRRRVQRRARRAKSVQTG